MSCSFEVRHIFSQTQSKFLSLVVCYAYPGSLVGHYNAIGDTISCDAPYSAMGIRGKLLLRYPLVGLSLDCDRPLLQKEVLSRGVAAIVCDTTENTVRQGYCYTCLAIEGSTSVGSLSQEGA